MKRTIINFKPIIMALLMIGTMNVQAQDGSTPSSDVDDSGGIRIGAKVLGLRSSFPDTKAGFGYGAGVFATIKPVDFLTVQVEALYVSSAGRLEDYVSDETLFDSTAYSKRNLRFYSIEVPVLVRYGLPFDLFGMSTNIYLGGAYSYNLGVYRIEDKTHYFNESNQVDSYTFKGSRDNISSGFEPYNIEALGGIGFGLQLFGKPAHLDLRYKYGFQNQNALNSLPIEGRPSDTKSRVISINLGVALF